MASGETLRLVVRRVIAATPERLFDAWTSPTELKQWWGPVGVDCVGAHVDARVGGQYRIDNRRPDGSIVVIRGSFLSVKAPSELVYTWQVGDADHGDAEHVSVRFEPVINGTEVVITHERIPNTAARDEHEVGWFGCLDGLDRYSRERT